MQTVLWVLVDMNRRSSNSSLVFASPRAHRCVGKRLLFVSQLRRQVLAVLPVGSIVVLFVGSTGLFTLAAHLCRACLLRAFSKHLSRQPSLMRVGSHHLHFDATFTFAPASSDQLCLLQQYRLAPVAADYSPLLKQSSLVPFRYFGCRIGVGMSLLFPTI